MWPLWIVSISFTLAVGIAYNVLIYPLALHPLRKIPRAHWTVPFPLLGSLWILYQRYRYRNNATTYAAHKRHGSIVRLGYNELSINCVDNGIRTVYGGGWEKHEWYARQFAGYGVINMFSTVHHQPHSEKKRTMSNIYAKSNLQTSPQLKSNSKHLLTDRFLPLLQSLSDTGKATNVHDMNNAFTMDFMTAYLFGIGRSTNFTQDLETRRTVMHVYHSRRDYEWHAAEVSPTIRRMMDSLRIPFVPQAVADANEYLEDWTSLMCKSADEYLSAHDTADAEDPGNEPVVYRNFKTGIARLRAKDPEAGREILPHIIDPTPLLLLNDDFKRMSEQELKSEMYDHLGAGHETSAIALTYLYWELSRDQSLQDRLYTELMSLDHAIKWPLPNKHEARDMKLPDTKAIDNLPYLHAIVMETLRLHPPIPGMEPRVSPHVAGGSTLGEYVGIPGGVRVSAMPYTLHRNPSVFLDPEQFDPTRWLTEDIEKLRDMHRWFWAFGSGGRMCIGSNLAMQEMKLIVAAMYSNWITVIVDDAGIEEVDTYTTRPKSNSLMLKYIHR